MRNWLIGLAFGVWGVAACNQNNATLATANLLAVDDVSLVCVETDTGTRPHVLAGRPLEECSDSAYDNRRLLALATQRETGEIAVLDASSCGFPSANAQTPCQATMVDVEIAQPGLNFLPVGAEPVGIVSTPGGTASFVAVAEPGKMGIFGLPSTCIGARERENGEGAEAIRDIRTWPACRLPATPSSIAMFRDLAKNPTRCDQSPDAPANEGAECPADLSFEARRGRLKLAVTLPDLGQLWTFDAQEVLDRAPGSYSPCVPELRVELRTERPDTLTQPIPAELSSEQKVYAGLSGSFVATPTDIAADLNANHGEMYVADRSAPVIHRLDTRDACNVREGDPLYPLSFSEPTAVIATRKVALSPVVDGGARYIYAVEESQRPTSGSVMVFDVSSVGETSQTPLVLEASQFIPDQAADRVSLGGTEASDVEFFFRDSQIVGDDGVVTSGLRCDPSPEADGTAEALFRPSSSGGAAPGTFRGLFAMASMHNGNLVLIDVDDYDSDCRRPASVRGEEDGSPGCPGDAARFDDGVTDLNDDGETIRVTDEVSCNIVQSHHIRSRQLYSPGLSAPRLRALPRLRSEEGTSLLVDQTEKGLEHPRMLAPYGQEGELLVGTTTYATDGDDAALLETNPARSESNTLLLPSSEPRSYWKHTGLAAATYEGILASAMQARLLRVTGAEYPRADLAGLSPSTTYGVLNGGPGALLCSLGIEDRTLVAERAAELQQTGGAAAAEMDADEYRAAFADYYGDYVEVLEPLLAEDHAYWQGEGQTCGEKYRGEGVDGREACQRNFGDSAEGRPERSFRVLRAFDDELVIEPREYGGTRAREAMLELLECCFPDALWYVPRTSHHWVYREATELSHDIETGPDGECRRSADPSRALQDFRAFEVACVGDDCDGVGAPSDDAVPTCVLDSTSEQALRGLPEACVFDGLTAQFALYRGQEPSARGMEFSWALSGGFAPFVIPMTAFGDRKQSNPQRMHFIPQIGRLAVTDGGPPSGRDNRPLAFVLLGFENASGASDITHSAVNYYYY